jgi:hypothetical protein
LILPRNKQREKAIAYGVMNAIREMVRVVKQEMGKTPETYDVLASI